MKFTIALTLCLITLTSRGQEVKSAQHMKDSLTFEALSKYSMRYPQLRQGFVAVDIIGKGSVKATLNGKDLYEGKNTMTRIRSNFNVPIVSWGKNSFLINMGYQQMHYQTNEVKSLDPQFIATDRSLDKSRFALTASFTRRDSIFNRPINFTGSISGITDEFSSIKRVNYLGTITMPIKRTQSNSLTLGVVIVIDPSAVLPVIPIISYWHRFKAADMELFVDLPSRIALRKQWSNRFWTSVGTELGGNLFFFDLNQPSLPRNAIYTSTEFRTGATLEYLVTKKIVVGMNAGLYTTTSNRLFDKNDKSSDYFAGTGSTSSPFVSFSVSFLPFLKSLKNFR